MSTLLAFDIFIFYSYSLRIDDHPSRGLKCGLSKAEMIAISLIERSC